MSELKPCPFCSSEDINYGHHSSESKRFNRCKQCLSEGPYGDSATSIAAWNTRPIEDALNQRIKELENELKAEKIRFQLLAETIRAVVK